MSRPNHQWSVNTSGDTSTRVTCSTASAAKQSRMLERDFQRAVIEVAHTFSWKVAHFRTAINARGHYQTPVGGDGAGWPDLVLAHSGSGRILFRELKSDTGRLAPNQQQWGDRLVACGCDWDVWRPADMKHIVTVLSGGRATTT